MDPAGSLGRDEAQRRSDLLEVAGYEIDLDLTEMRDGDAFRARTTVRFRCRRPGESTFVDCLADVVAAELNGTSISTESPHGRLTLPGLAAENILVVESVQHDTASRAGVHRSVDHDDGLAYVWTSFEPDEARRAWACFDQPDLKAPHTFTVVAPADWTVASNTAPESVTDGPDGARVWRFVPTPPLSTYVPVVNAGPFHEVRRQQGGFDLGLFCRRSLATFVDRDADELFDVTAAGLAFFGERFAMPFPQERYDQVFAPELGGAMENYGCVTWSDYFVFRHAPSYSERELRAVVLLHEMAHMWFGDIVTMRWWDDLWLNEAFADWAASWAAQAATPYRDAWATFLVERKISGYAADRAPTTHPIRQDAPDVASATAGFDMITYAKGASVLRQLVAYVGEDAFVSGLRSYFARHAWGNAALDDLIGAVSAASGRDLRDWVAGWLDGAGTDTLTVDSGSDPARLVATGPDGTPPRPHVLGVGLYDGAAGAPLERREFATVEVGAAPAVLPFSARSADVVLVNDDDLTFAQVVPDAASLDALLDSAPRLPTPLARSLAVTTAWGLVTTGRLPTARFLTCTTAVLAVEPTEAIVEPMLDLAVEAARLWSGDGERDTALRLVADVCVPIASQAGKVRTAALRGLASTAVTDEHFAILESAAAADSDLRWRTLRRQAALGRLEPDAVAAAESVDPDPDRWAQVVLVQASRPDPAAKDVAWQAVIGKALPLGLVGTMGRVFWQPDQAEIVAPYADRLLEALPALGRGGMIDAMALSSAMFPVVGIDDDFLDRLTTAVQSPDVSPVVRRTALGRADEVRRMLAARRSA